MGSLEQANMLINPFFNYSLKLEMLSKMFPPLQLGGAVIGLDELLVKRRGNDAEEV